MNNNSYEQVLHKLSMKASKKGEIPVAALIVKDNKIISTAYNKRNKSNNPLLHAEIKCIMKATKKLKDWRLTGCTLYVTLEPCHMCKEIIRETRIEKVYYYLKNEKEINYKSSFIHIQNEYSTKYKKILTTFFKNLR